MRLTIWNAYLITWNAYLITWNAYLAIWNALGYPNHTNRKKTLTRNWGSGFFPAGSAESPTLTLKGIFQQ